MEEQYSTPTTTADSAADGRMKVAAGCSHGRKKCLKCAIGKAKDGKGGPGFKIDAAGYGATHAQTTIAPQLGTAPTTSKKHRSVRGPGSIRMPGMKSLSSSSSSVAKKMTFGKTLKGMKASKMKSLRIKIKKYV